MSWYLKIVLLAPYVLVYYHILVKFVAKNGMSHVMRKPDFCLSENKDADHIGSYLHVSKLFQLRVSYWLCGHPSIIWLFNYPAAFYLFCPS